MRYGFTCWRIIRAASSIEKTFENCPLFVIVPNTRGVLRNSSSMKSATGFVTCSVVSRSIFFAPSQ